MCAAPGCMEQSLQIKDFQVSAASCARFMTFGRPCKTQYIGPVATHWGCGLETSIWVVRNFISTLGTVQEGAK